MQNNWEYTYEVVNSSSKNGQLMMTAGVRCFAASENNRFWYCTIHYLVCFPDTFLIALKDNTIQTNQVMYKTMESTNSLKSAFGFRDWPLFTDGPRPVPIPIKSQIPIPNPDGMFPGSGTVWEVKTTFQKFLLLWCLEKSENTRNCFISLLY